MKTTKLILPILTLCAAILSGCANQELTLKAHHVAPSAFLENPGSLSTQKQRAPFDTIWVDPSHPDTGAGYKSVYIAPVTTQYLRPVNRPLVTVMEGPKAKDRPVQGTADVVRNSFIKAFRTSPAQRFQVVDRPGPGVLVVEMALVELNPTNVIGNAVKYGAPGGEALGPITKGNVALECKVRDGATKKLLLQFADNEQDKFAPVSLRDLSSYGHARQAIYDWAKEFEELLRTPPSHKVVGASPVTLNPF